MFKRNLSIGLFLAMFCLVLPLSVRADNSTCGLGEEAKVLGETEICLQWFSPEEGSKVHQVFDTDISTHICKTSKMSCFVGKDGGVSLLDCNGRIDPANITYDKPQQAFTVLGDARQRVECKDSSGKVQIIDSEYKSTWACKLTNPSAIWKKWAGDIFLPDQEIKLTSDGKVDYGSFTWAEPWSDQGQAYCPDPAPSYAINAYQLSDDAKKGKTQASPELVQRYLLQSCSTVIKHLQNTCEQASSEVLKGKEGDIRLAKKSQDLVKLEVIGELITGERKECKGDCLKVWEKIKGLTISDFGQGEVNELSVSKKLLEFGLTEKNIASLSKLIKPNVESWDKSNHETLNDYIDSLAKEEWTATNDELTTEAAKLKQDIQDADLKESDIQEIISFLNKRYLNLQMHYALSTTKTYNVTKLLKRSKDSTEADLVLFGSSDPERNIIDKVIRLVGQILGSFGVLLLIISGVMMVVSRGEETMLQTAKNTFMYTLVGLVLAFLSYTIVRFIIELLLDR